MNTRYVSCDCHLGVYVIQAQECKGVKGRVSQHLTTEKTIADGPKCMHDGLKVYLYTIERMFHFLPRS